MTHSYVRPLCPSWPDHFPSVLTAGYNRDMGWLKNIVRYYAPPGYIKDERARACCSFCRKSYRQVGPLVEGPNGVYICDQCIDLCRSIMDAERRKRGTICPMCGAAVRVLGRCSECGEVFVNPSAPDPDATPESN